MQKQLIFITFLLIYFNALIFKAQSQSAIKPWSKNSSYWQFKGKPVLLLGASNEDNLFQCDDMEAQLDRLAAVGGNYIRNVMSDRDEGNLRAFAKTANGQYDLNNWNDTYWEKFQQMLELTNERNIIVQIEIWDRFDHSGEYKSEKSGKSIRPWQNDPFNPKNNINYNYEESKFKASYSQHPGTNQQPFFFTIPALNNNPTVLSYQKAFVKKLLSISLIYPNVLYCIDNETSGSEEWGAYWAQFIRKNSDGKKLYITEMWDNWNVTSPTHKRTIDHPEVYDFIDLSQNSHNKGHKNWTIGSSIFSYIQKKARPVNSTKVYGNDNGKWYSTEHAVQTVCRNIMQGFASSRFHRPKGGIGISKISLNCIKTIREVEKHVNLLELDNPRDLTDENGNEAYLRSWKGKKHLVYLPQGGQVKLDLTHKKKHRRYSLKWISTDDALWSSEIIIQGGEMVILDAGDRRSCFAVLEKK